MTLRELRFIVSVAQEKNFRRAADISFVSQPALSLAIKKIENELGVLIFERNRTEVSITVIGEKILRQAIIVLDEAEKNFHFLKDFFKEEEVNLIVVGLPKNMNNEESSIEPLILKYIKIINTKIFISIVNL